MQMTLKVLQKHLEKLKRLLLLQAEESKNGEVQVARQFSEALLDSPADLIEVDLKFVGDPIGLQIVV